MPMEWRCGRPNDVTNISFQAGGQGFSWRGRTIRAHGSWNTKCILADGRQLYHIAGGTSLAAKLVCVHVHTLPRFHAYHVQRMCISFAEQIEASQDQTIISICS